MFSQSEALTCLYPKNGQSNLRLLALTVITEKEAENWSVNLLHPYRGNVSTIGDCYKLAQLKCPERLAVIVIGYEHSPAKIDLTPLVNAFEVIVDQVAGITLSKRIEIRHDGLVHPVHQSLRVFAWEVISIAI